MFHRISYMPPKPKPVMIRGVTYKNCKEAAQELLLSPKTIQKAIRRGTLDTVGLGREARPWGPAAKPIRIQGVEYPSRKIAAEVLGLSQTALASRISRGTLHKIS